MGESPVKGCYIQTGTLPTDLLRQGRIAAPQHHARPAFCRFLRKDAAPESPFGTRYRFSSERPAIAARSLRLIIFSSRQRLTYSTRKSPSSNQFWRQ
jgi:hypothetical protein